MTAGQIVALPYTGDFLRKGCRSTGASDDIRHKRRKSKVATLGTHQRNQCSGPLKGPSADGVTLRRVGIEKRFRGPSIHRCAEFPAQIDCISDSEIQPLTANGCKDMSSVSRQQNPSKPIGAGLTGIVGPPRGRVNGGEHYVSPGDLPQACLQLFESDGGVPVFRWTVEFHC